MNNPVKPDDDDQKWEGYPGHTKAKHELVRYYLNCWFRKLSSPNRKLRVFDCFAGRGEYYPTADQESVELEHLSPDVDIHGSPQIILDTAIKYSSGTREIECVFTEKESTNADILESNLPPRSTLPSNVTYTVETGKFEDETRGLVRKTGGWNCPTFFFIDPFGYKALEYDLITDLGSTERFEILINLMASEVVRWQDVEKHQEPLEIPFGTPGWREELEQFEPEHWNNKEVSYYCHRLELQGPEYSLSYLVTEEETKAMKYYLVFGTNHEDGIELVREAMQNCGPGEFAYAPNRPEMSKDQMSIGTVTKEQERAQLKQTLLTEFSGQTLSFNDIVRKFVTNNMYGSARRKEIRTALKELESAGKIKVERITSKTEKGLGGKDRITFSEEL